MPISCWQTTSSGAAIVRRGSIRPARGRCGRDHRAGKLGGGRCEQQPPRRRARRCPDRPTRCTHRATPPGRPTCTARSAVPMSTPSSRLVLVTTAFRRARLERRFDLRGGARRRAPSGCAATASAADLGRPPQVVGDLLGQGPRVGEDDRRPALDRSPGRAGGAAGDRSGRDAGPRRADQRLDLQGQRRRVRRARAPRPPGTSATARPGTARPARRPAGRRQSDPARVVDRPAPRAVRARPPGRPRAWSGTSAWTSSTIRCSHAAPVLVPGRLAEQQRQALGRRDQQVRRPVARSFLRCVAEVSPVRTPTVTGLCASPSARRIASSGTDRFRSMS